jgi:hypothetical protein
LISTSNRQAYSKEKIVARKIRKDQIVIALVLLFGIILSGCGVIPGIITGGPVVTPDNGTGEPGTGLPPVVGPDAAREVVLDFVSLNYGTSAPASDLIWLGDQVPSEGLVGSSKFQYTAHNWVMEIQFPIVTPDATIYNVKMQSSAGFKWEGLVDAYGQVATTTVTLGEPTETGSDVEPDPTVTPPPVKVSFRDDIYKLSMEYPVDWTLTEIPAGGQTSKALKFTKGDWVLIVHYKFRWENSGMGGSLPAGDVVDRGYVNLLDRAIPKHLVIKGGQEKVVYYGDRFSDLEFYIRLDEDLRGYKDYDVVDIPEDIMAEMDALVDSIVRTGDPVVPPTPTPTPTPTPVPVPCNAAKFIKDVTIPDGTTFAPDTDFRKTWRIKNIGTCTWTKEYDLIFVDGARMGGQRALAISESVKPGETIDLSVALTSPDTSGDYKGFWMLRSEDGVIFGLGGAANKAFWVDISVAKSVGGYGYDFALNYCAATWRSDVDRLSCTGGASSEDGFVSLEKNPRLENRKENELALWVHPNEEKGGWIEGIYPFYEIDDDDHFITWVGCMDDYNKCSLKFYLDYEDENGKIHHLGEWLEVYDEQVTKIDIDLSDLDGESVRFILGAEANTKNADAAQGFWFVPRIENFDTHLEPL